MDEDAFHKALDNAKVPVLVLDQKWHRLFAVSGKPDSVLEKEKKLRDLLAEQGQLNIDLKNVKKIKNQLMKDIVDNMEGEEGSKHISSQKMDEDKRLIDEANEKLASIEDRLMELPKEISLANTELMFDTMSFCYSKIRTNLSDISEISEWIKNIRLELKKNIIRKQNREINNREIYSYMHDIFGKDVLNLFDIRFEDENGTSFLINSVSSHTADSTEKIDETKQSDNEKDIDDSADTEGIGNNNDSENNDTGSIDGTVISENQVKEDSERPRENINDTGIHRKNDSLS